MSSIPPVSLLDQRLAVQGRGRLLDVARQLVDAGSERFLDSWCDGRPENEADFSFSNPCGEEREHRKKMP